ncbi:MAG TPA: hypothetical protein VGO37_01495 [Steroidobacteraceae bacterium]|nr:hypothetical protein [Steroidobacteraceae bacterium]
MKGRVVSRLLAIGMIASLTWPGLASAQLLRLKPLPPKKEASALAAASAAVTHATTHVSRWQALPNQPPVLDAFDCGPGSPILLTDGTVMVADNGCQDWWKLTPDAFGSYLNGTWTQLSSTPSGYSPLYHATAVLPDGRVIIEGGEYNELAAVWTTQGAIYDPVADTWTSVNPPAGWTTIGDAPGVVLSQGTFMLGNCCTAEAALLNPKTLTWTPIGTGKFDTNNEEGWTLLPGGNVLTVDAYVPINIPYLPTGTNSEIFVPKTGKWHSAGSTIVQLWDSWATCGQLTQEPTFGPTFEVGPAVLRPDGTVFYMGSNTCGPGYPGSTAIYDSERREWRAGPNFPGSLNIADGPAALEPNGKVLMMASPGYGNPPSSFLEWDGENLTTIEPAPNAATDGSFYGNFLVLPTGQILLTDFYTVSLYTPKKGYDEEWAPRIESAPETVRPGGSYVISGHMFNGMSQGAAYGDDSQSATNYPLVRITNKKTGHVFYSRTHDHSSMAVAFHGRVSTHFDVPAGQELGESKLVVVANGIPSEPIDVRVGSSKED